MHINLKMVQTSDGAANNDWISFMRACAVGYKKRRSEKAGVPSRHQSKMARGKVGEPANRNSKTPQGKGVKCAAHDAAAEETKRARTAGKRSIAALNEAASAADEFSKERDDINNTSRKRIVGKQSRAQA